METFRYRWQYQFSCVITMNIIKSSSCLLKATSKRAIAVAIISTASIIGLVSPQVKAVPYCDEPELPAICDSSPPRLRAQRQVVVSTMRISGELLRGLVNALNNAAMGTQIHMNNYGADDSYILLSERLGGSELRFSFPTEVLDLDCGFLCPDLGDATFYVQDLNLESIQLEWQSPNLKLSLFFESNGREIKGFHSGSIASFGDNGIPDVEIDNARLDVYLEVVASNGRLTYTVANTAFNANIQATGPCNAFGVDICQGLFHYKDRVVSEIENNVRNRLNDQTTHDRVDNVIYPILDSLRLSSINIIDVYASGDALVISY